jgi:hypothetical protein
VTLMGRVGSNPTPGATEQNPMFFERTRIVVVDQHSNFIMSVFFTQPSLEMFLLCLTTGLKKISRAHQMPLLE